MQEFVKKLIERVEERIQENTNEDMSYKIPYFGLEIALNIVNQLAEEYKINLSEKLTSSDGWIPCSERLPEGKESYKVLVTDEDGIMAVCYFLEITKIFKVCWDGEEFQDVIAWQPLPEHYQPKGE